MGTRFHKAKALGAGTAVALATVSVAAAAGAVAAAMRLTGSSFWVACFAVTGGAGWGGLTFAAGWWLAASKREHVGSEVACVLLPVLRELKHLRGALAQRSGADELAKTQVHPRRIPPISDEAPTMVMSYEGLREVAR